MTIDLKLKLQRHYPSISDHAVDEFEKLLAGQRRIDGLELGHLGLAYRSRFMPDEWVLTDVGARFIP
jgi:hypothetical protein